MPKSLFERALASVETFSDKNVAILPERPCAELMSYLAEITGEDIDKLKRYYELFLIHGRLDSYKQDPIPSAGFAEN